MLNDLIHAIDAFAGAVIVSSCILRYRVMRKTTKNCWRFVYGLLGVAGLALVALPFNPAYEITIRPMANVFIIAAVAIYLVLDQRRVRF